MGKSMSVSLQNETNIYYKDILMYGAEVWQIPTREIKKISATEMDVLRRSARKSRLERIKNEYIKEIMGVKEKPDIIDIIERKCSSGMATLKGCKRTDYQN
jgi:hypothetical protein